MSTSPHHLKLAVPALQRYSAQGTRLRWVPEVRQLAADGDIPLRPAFPDYATAAAWASQHSVSVYPPADLAAAELDTSPTAKAPPGKKTRKRR
jgi:hypothetical protein